MGEYVILTDSSADLSAKMVAELGVEVIPLSFTMEEQTYHNWPDNREMDPGDFYRRLREGAMATTAAVNVAEYTQAMEPILKQGKDVLVLAFSSGLSATCNSARIAAGELSEQYPDRKVFVVDTLCASLGQGLLVWHAARQKQAGKTIEEAMEVTNKAVMEALDGLPPVKIHCSLLAEEAIHAALWDYAEKHHIKIEGLSKPKSDIHEGEEDTEEEY